MTATVTGPPSAGPHPDGPLRTPPPGLRGRLRSFRARPDRTRPPAPPAPLWAQLVRAIAVGVAVITVWMLGYALVLSPFQEHHDQGVLYGRLRSELANQTAPLGGVIAPGSPIAVMDMPAAGIRRTVVVEGTASGDLMAGPGHYRTSVLPGQAGLSILYGRDQLFGAPFGAIASARRGARITFVTGEGTSTYRVTKVVRPGQRGPTPSANALVLVTAAGTGWRSGWAPSQVVYVFAALTGKPFPADTGQYAQVPSSEQPMRGDMSALYVLVLWLPLLLGAVLAVLWAGLRWGRWQAYLLGVPVLLALLWGTSEAVVRLLPNLV